MPTGNDCPVCGENIGVVAVFKAPVPNRIYCPHCGERLRYGETSGLIAAAVVLLIGLTVVGIGAATQVGFRDPLISGALLLGVLLIGGAALEVVFVMILWYGEYRLEPVNRLKDDWDEF
jgi:uncharacterized protein (DUF983 family)